MKTFALLVLLLAATLSFAQGPFPPEPTSLQHIIVSKERAELNCLKQSDVQCFSDLIADNAVFIDGRGPANKQQVLSHAGSLKVSDFTISDVHYVPMGNRSGMIAYKLAISGSSNGRDFSRQVFVSALWAERDGNWQCLFSQETPAEAHSGM